MKNANFPQADVTLEDYRKYIKSYDKYCAGIKKYHGTFEYCLPLSKWLPLHKVGMS